MIPPFELEHVRFALLQPALDPMPGNGRASLLVALGLAAAWGAAVMLLVW